MPKQKKSSGLYRAEYYMTRESQQSPYAATPDESKWQSTAVRGLDDALAKAKGWTVDGNYKATRVVEVDEDGDPISIVWASAWEAPTTTQEATAGVDGFACKLMIWMHRDYGRPDHWQWGQRLRPYMNTPNGNSWELAYGRPVDTRGRMTLYSVKLNHWPVGAPHPSEWEWHALLGKDPELQQDEVEFVRAAEIGPRTFPPGAELVECIHCGRTHQAETSWRDVEDEFFCSCQCLDNEQDTDAYRIDPDGLEFEDPGCEQAREGVTTG